MYLPFISLSLLFFLYCILSHKIEQSVITPPIIFVLMGVICGPILALFPTNIATVELRMIADVALAIILFVDAANANLKALKANRAIVLRMLMLGMPGVIALGTLLGYWLFEALSLLEVAIMATALAATDAALGKAVVSNKQVPIALREGLNAESGLNDGLAVPILLLLISLATQSSQTDPINLAITLVVGELGIAFVIGVIGSVVGAYLLNKTLQERTVSPVGKHLVLLALVLVIFSCAQTLHSSGYIACFVAGLFFSYFFQHQKHELLINAESNGEALSLFTWFIFGAAVLPEVIENITITVLIYSMLSLTVIRILPIMLALIGTAQSPKQRLFLAWFGPRGLASVVFGIMIINSQLEHGSTITAVIVCTISLSLLLHGITARPIIAAMTKGN